MRKVFLGLLVVASVASAGGKTKRNPAQHGTGNVDTALANEYNVDAASAAAKGARSIDKNLAINPARIDAVTTLINKTVGKKMNLQVKVIVHSTGGSADVSPRKQISFGIYSENEMFDVIAAYDIGHAYSVKSIKRISGGLYEVRGAFTSDDFMNKKTSVILIDAIKAINELQNVKYDENSGSDSPEIKSEITVTPKA